MGYKLEKPFKNTERAEFICEHQGMKFDEDENAIYMLEEWENIENGEIIGSQTDIPYITSKVLQLSTQCYKYIIDKYDEALKYGVFALNSEYYANMAWYETWAKAVSLYEDDGYDLDDIFTVRLYKSNSTIDGKYYNYNTSQNISTLKSFLSTLNRQQFVTYQPIKNNLISQLSIYANSLNIDGINQLFALADSEFGDIINEATTIVEYGV